MLNLILGILLRQHYIAMLVASKFIEQILVSEALAILLLSAEVLGDGEVGHNRLVVDRVNFDLVQYLVGVLERLGDVAEQLRHFVGGLEPLLFGVAHAALIVEVCLGRDTNQVVVSLGILFVDKVRVVGGYEFDIILAGKSYNLRLDLLLLFVGLVIGIRDSRLMALQFEIVVVTHEVFPPLDRLVGAVDVAAHQQARNFTAKTSRGDYQALVSRGY